LDLVLDVTSRILELVTSVGRSSSAGVGPGPEGSPRNPAGPAARLASAVAAGRARREPESQSRPVRGASPHGCPCPGPALTRRGPTRRHPTQPLPLNPPTRPIRPSMTRTRATSWARRRRTKKRPSQPAAPPSGSASDRYDQIPDPASGPYRSVSVPPPHHRGEHPPAPKGLPAHRPRQGTLRSTALTRPPVRKGMRRSRMPAPWNTHPYAAGESVIWSPTPSASRPQVPALHASSPVCTSGARTSDLAATHSRPRH
jgi:hypothetical protein